MKLPGQGTMIDCASEAGVMNFIAPHVVSDVSIDDITHDIDYNMGTRYHS